MQTIATIRLLLKNRKGVTALEYGLIAGLIAAVIIVALTTMGGKLSNMFSNINNSLR